MASSRPEVRRSFIRILGFTFVGVFGGLALTTCGSEPIEGEDESAISEDDVEMSSQALSSAQCRYFTNNRQRSTRICHYDSKKRKHVGQTVNEHGCCSHTGHSKDYVAAGDSNCTGAGCIPLNAPCDGTKRCCAGSSCKRGKCQPDLVCVPQGMPCVQLGTPCCPGSSCTTGEGGSVCNPS
jgi:hypothetical protein